MDTRITSIGNIGGVETPSTPQLTDPFSQKLGDWAFVAHKPSMHNEKDEPLGRHNVAPVDANVMDYLEQALLSENMPVAQAYVSELRMLQEQVGDPAVKAILEQDLALYDEWFARRLGELHG